MKQVLPIIIAIFIGLFLLFPQISYADDIVTTGKLISVDLNAQKLYAWENGQIVYQTPISSGLWQSPTVKGTFKVYRKIPLERMRGYSPVHGYYDLWNVPSTMYFYWGYAIHGAYWHNNFGNPMSNGCVNLPLDAAAWVYDFAQVGTTVTIY